MKSPHALFATVAFIILLTPVFPASAQEDAGAQDDAGTFEEKMDPIINVSNSTGTYSFLPQVAKPGPASPLHVIWQESMGILGNSFDFAQANNDSRSLSIVYRTSEDDGTTFGEAATLYNYTSPSQFGSTPVSYGENGSAYLAWVDNSTNDDIDVYFSRTSENGTRFENPAIIGRSTIAGNDTGAVEGLPGQTERLHQIIYPQIATSGEQVYVMWTEMLAVITEAPDIPQAPINQSGGISEAAMNGTGGNASDFSFRDYLPEYDIDRRVFLAISNDSGRSFGEPQVILNETAESGSAFSIIQPATLTVSADNVYVVIAGGSGEDLKDRRLSLFVSRDGSTSFEEKQIAPAIDNGTGRVPVYANPVVDGNSSLYMLVTVAENKTKSILENEGGRINPYLPSFFDLAYSHYFIRSDDAADTFSAPVQIANDTGSALGSQLAVSEDGSGVYVAWLDPGIDVFDLLSSRSQSGSYVSSEELEKLNPAGSVLVRASTDKGDTFGEITRLNGSKPSGRGGVSFHGDAGLLLPHGDSGLYVIKSRIMYHDPLERILPSSEVLLWSSTDGGSSFQGPARISDNIGGSQFGSFGGSRAAELTPEAIYVVWSGEDDAGNQDIFFRKLGR